MKFRLTPIDPKKEKGAPMEYFGATLYVARAKNTEFIKALREELNTDDFDAVDFGSPDAIDATIRAMCKGVLVGWDDLEVYDEDSEKTVKLKYSQENAIALLSNDEDLREKVSAFSNDIDNFYFDKKAKLVGKS